MTLRNPKCRPSIYLDEILPNQEIPMKLSEGKTKHLNALADKRGVIAALAIDQRGSMRKMIATAKGVSQSDVSEEMMEEFKVIVSKTLTPHASAILLDPEFGLPAAKARAKNAGLLLAYEESGNI